MLSLLDLALELRKNYLILCNAVNVYNLPIHLNFVKTPSRFVSDAFHLTTLMTHVAPFPYVTNVAALIMPSPKVAQTSSTIRRSADARSALV